jgi:hypothetical protein
VRDPEVPEKVKGQAIPKEVIEKFS